MSILDDAIREHLELKRAHGANEGELQKLEDEAFGPPQRPDEVDPFAEAPTEFLATPAETAADAPGIGDEAEPTGRRPDIADLQEAPPAPADAAPGAVEDELSPTPDAPPPSPTAAADVPLPPPPGEAPAADLAPPTGETPAPPAEEEAEAAEPEATPETSGSEAEDVAEDADGDQVEANQEPEPEATADAAPEKAED